MKAKEIVKRRYKKALDMVIQCAFTEGFIKGVDYILQNNHKAPTTEEAIQFVNEKGAECVNMIKDRNVG